MLAYMPAPWILWDKIDQWTRCLVNVFDKGPISHGPGIMVCWLEAPPRVCSIYGHKWVINVDFLTMGKPYLEDLCPIVTG